MKYVINFLVGLIFFSLVLLFAYSCYEFGWEIVIGIPIIIIGLYKMGESLMDIFK